MYAFPILLSILDNITKHHYSVIMAHCSPRNLTTQERTSMKYKILFIVVIVYAITISVFCFYRNPLPIPDRGQRCFTVKTYGAAQGVVAVMDRIGGIPERFTFDSGPTHQTLLWDNTTVIMRFDPSFRDSKLGNTSGLSIPVADPISAAREAQHILSLWGVTSIIHENIDPDLGDNLVILESDDFAGWAMVFRRHVLKMPDVKTRTLSR